MFRALRLVFCIFLTSGFAGLVQPAYADYCFENTNKKGIMPGSICFREIKVIKPGTREARVFLKSKQIEKLYPISKRNPEPSGFSARIQGDYINYTSNCGLTILSEIDFHLNVDARNEYLHNSENSLEIKYQYTPDSCKYKVTQGLEQFTAIVE